MNFLKRFLKKLKKSSYSIGTGTYGISYSSVRSFRHFDEFFVGNYCSIAPKVTFLLSGEHNYKHVSTYPFFDRFNTDTLIYRDTFTKGSIIIGSDVWIGYGATILSGVNIGNGAVIGAEAVITKDVPPYAIVVGNPSKILKYRFTEYQIKELLSIEWWNWDAILIQQRKNDFYLPIEDFINKYKTTI